MSGDKSLILAAVMALTALLASCSQKEDSDFLVNQDLAARIGNVKITRSQLDDRYENLAPTVKRQYKGKGGKARFVDMVIDEELMYLAAQETDLKYEEEIKKKIKTAEKNILVSAYFDKEIKGKVNISDQEIERYYNEHINDFMNLAVMKAQHIYSRSDSTKVAAWRRRLENGERFDRIAKEESEDTLRSMNYGNLGYFNPGGYVRFYGDEKRFSDQIQHLEEGEISDVVVTSKGYSLVKVNERRPATPKPLSEVRNTILGILRDERAKEVLDAEIASLREKYKPENFLSEELAEAARTPEELWEMAQQEDAYYTRILYYRDLVNRYPDHKYAPQALFMIGFVYAEEAMDLVQARRTFDELLKRYPDSDVAESAAWMIENMQKPHPKFESVDDMKKKMEGDK